MLLVIRPLEERAFRLLPDSFIFTERRIVIGRKFRLPLAQSIWRVARQSRVNLIANISVESGGGDPYNRNL